MLLGFLIDQKVKNSPAMQETWICSMGGTIPKRKGWLTTPLFMPWKCYGGRNIAGYRPWDLKESDTTEWLTLPQKCRCQFIEADNTTLIPCFQIVLDDRELKNSISCLFFLLICLDKNYNLRQTVEPIQKLTIFCYPISLVFFKFILLRKHWFIMFNVYIIFLLQTSCLPPKI